MSPFQQFRLWARRAPLAERIGGLTACLLALAAVVWLVVPGGGPGQLTTAVGGAGPGTGAAGPSAVTSGSGGSGPGSNAGGASPASGSGGGTAAGPGASSSGGPSSVNGSPSPGAAAAPATGPAAGVGGPSASVPSGAPGGPSSPAPAARGCPQPAGAVSGVTASEIKIAVTLTEIVGPAANSTFGLPSVSEQQSDYQEVIDALNATGGVDCRKLVPQFYPVNAADQTDQQQQCLNISQAGVFASLDFTAYSTVGGGCFGEHKLPFFIDYFLTSQDTNQFYPYQFGINTYDSLYHNTIFALKDRGFFSPSQGFKKLGFVYRDCFPTLAPEMTNWLQQAGVPASDIVSFDVGCPAAFATPDVLEQAVLKFEQAGVTNVTAAYFLGDFANFTTIAEQQGFHPKYGIGDDGTINISYGSQHPDYQNIAGAIAITASAWGEERTPGMTPSPTTAKCNAIFAAHGQPPVYQQNTGAGGLVCDELWMFAAAVEHAPSLSQGSLGAGLAAARSVPFSYPEGPNDFTGTHVTTGGQFWRTDQFVTSCNCWRVIDPTFHPSF